MSNEINFRPLSVCTDCHLFIHNGETGQGADHDEFIAMAQYQVWGTQVLSLIGGHKELGFDTSECQGCENALAGDRFKAYMLDNRVGSPDRR